MKNKSLLITIAILVIAMNLAAQKTDTFKDKRDGKTYKTVKIGTQTWMAENLAYKAESGCWAYDNNLKNVTTYGYLYNWKTANKACPSGWHLPTDEEWTTLTDYLGGDSVAGGKLKETGNTFWKRPNTGATNESGFAGLPGGHRNINGEFVSFEKGGYWWSSGEYGDSDAFDRLLHYIINSLSLIHI